MVCMYLNKIKRLVMFSWLCNTNKKQNKYENYSFKYSRIENTFCQLHARVVGQIANTIRKPNSNLRTENMYSISAHTIYINQKLHTGNGNDYERQNQQLLIVNIYQIDTLWLYIVYSYVACNLANFIIRFYRIVISSFPGYLQSLIVRGRVALH